MPKRSAPQKLEPLSIHKSDQIGPNISCSKSVHPQLTLFFARCGAGGSRPLGLHSGASLVEIGMKKDLHGGDRCDRLLCSLLQKAVDIPLVVNDQGQDTLQLTVVCRRVPGPQSSSWYSPLCVPRGPAAAHLDVEVNRRFRRHRAVCNPSFKASPPTTIC